MKKHILAVLFVFGAAYQVHAAPSPQAKMNRFHRQIETYRKQCTPTSCRGAFRQLTVYHFKQPGNAQIPMESQSSLSQVAFEQAQVWGDTILEGDYQSEGNTRLDSAMAIYHRDQLVGFKITYSERAWYVGGDEKQEGRIHESSFVSPDFQSYFQDENDLAEFSR